MPASEAARREPNGDVLDREIEEFTLVGRGPARRLFARVGLANREGRITPARVVLLTAIAWLPALALSGLRGQALGWPQGTAFLEDLVTQVRLLVALPLYLLLDEYVNVRLKRVVGEFVRRGVAPDRAHYARNLVRIQDAAGSAWAEMAMLTVAIGSAYLWHARDPSAAWWNGGGPSWTPAGRWYLGVVLPLIHFLFYRWIWRFLVWAGFLVSMARMDLKVVATHPDGAGGLSFVGTTQMNFAVVTASMMAVSSAQIGNRILYHGESVRGYEMAIVVALGAMLFLVVCPVLAFTPLLLRVKREGKLAYGRLGMEYVQDFHRKWIQGQGAGPSLLGTPDLQSLADLANSYRVAADMNVVLFNRKTLTMALALNLAPFLPLALSLMSLPELLKKVISLLR